MIMMKRSDTKRRTNKGITLVELVIVVAILGILLGFASYNAFVINGYRARQCKNNLATAISELKVRTLSKAAKTGDIYMEIYDDGKAIYSKVHYKTGEDEPKLIAKRVKVRYGSGPSSVTAVGAEGSGLIITYNRSTGAFVDNVGGSYPVSTTKYIGCSFGDKVYELELVPETGKVINKTDKKQFDTTG